MPEELKNVTFTGMFWENIDRTHNDQGRLRRDSQEARLENHVTVVTPSLSKSSLYNMFSVQTRTERRFELKRVFELFHFLMIAGG